MLVLVVGLEPTRIYTPVVRQFLAENPSTILSPQLSYLKFLCLSDSALDSALTRDLMVPRKKQGCSGRHPPN
jgi:hypothetical protein